MSRAAEGFRARRFATNLLALVSVVSAVSGVILFFRPEGSLARWTDWSVFGLDKAHWEALHIVFVGLFLLVSLVHVWYNWAPLVAYLRQKSSALSTSGRVALPSRELMAAAAVTLAVFAGTLVDWQPFSGVLALRSAVKDGALLAALPPPVPDVDRRTFADLCREQNIPEGQAVRRARSRGIDVPDTAVTIAGIARANDTSPEAVYRAIRQEDDSRMGIP